MALNDGNASSRRGRRATADGDLLNRITSIVAGPDDLGTALGNSLDEILKALELSGGAIRLTPAAEFSPSFLSRRIGNRLAQELARAELEPLAGTHFAGGERLFRKHLDSVRAQGIEAALIAEGAGFFAVSPMRRGGQFLGALILLSRKKTHPVLVHREYLPGLANLLALAICGARESENAAKLAEDLVALREVNKIISQTFDLEDIIQRIVVEGRRLVKTRQCHLFLIDERQQMLIGAASTQEGLRIQDVSFKLGEDSFAVRALRQDRALPAGCVPPHDSSNVQLGLRAAIFAPLIVPSIKPATRADVKGRPIGVLVCSDECAERAFAREEVSRAETLAHQAAIAIDNARLFQIVSRSQKDWESTFDAMQDCVSVHDTSGKIFRANVALARRLKTTPPKMIGKYCAEIYNPAQLTFSPCRHMDALHSESLVVEELELPGMGGTFQLSVSPWYDKNNRLVGSIHVAKDISNEKLLQQQLIQSEKLSAIGELISGIAHELNNPLTGVMGYSQLLQLRKDLDERARESLLKINNLALRCQKIVQNLLSFARKQKPERTLSNVNEILERTVELRNYELSVNNITIVRDLERNLPKTIADAHQLQQVFLNVITNAEQAMLNSHGRGCLTIRSYADRPNNHVVVEIVDDGPGISDANLSKIFDPFFTTKEVGKGTGLGLSLSYGIIKEHGGHIYAISRQGEGATFIIKLPIIAAIADDLSIFPQLKPEAIHFDTLVRDKRILIVDDEPYILDFFKEIFRHYPLKVDTAADGMAAMNRLIQDDYDLVITDFKMPQMSGRELFEWIRQKRPHLTERIVFVTGDTISAETRSFFERHCATYLAKPFKIEEVKEVIQQVLMNE